MNECKHDCAELSRIRADNGAWHCGWYCHDCGSWIVKGGNAGIWLKQENIDVDVLPVIHYGESRECDHCGRLEFCEYHHWAPRQFFGAECDDWPTAWLCVECHELWHERIGQPIRRG